MFLILKQKIQEEEENLLYHQVHPGRCFGLEPESSDLELECNGERKVTSIPILIMFLMTLHEMQSGCLGQTVKGLLMII